MAFLVICCLFSKISTATPTTVLLSTLSEDFVPITRYCQNQYIIKQDSKAGNPLGQSVNCLMIVYVTRLRTRLF